MTRQQIIRLSSAFLIAFLVGTVPLIGASITCADYYMEDVGHIGYTYMQCLDAGASWLWQTYCWGVRELALIEAEHNLEACLVLEMIGG